MNYISIPIENSCHPIKLFDQTAYRYHVTHELGERGVAENVFMIYLNRVCKTTFMKYMVFRAEVLSTTGWP